MTVNLKRLRALDLEATPPPWGYREPPIDSHGAIDTHSVSPVPFAGRYVAGLGPTSPRDHQLRRDARFIAVSRNAVPEILALLEEARDLVGDSEYWDYGRADKREEYTARRAAFLAAFENTQGETK